MKTHHRQYSTYHVIHHSDEQVEEQPAAALHLHLHRAAALEGAAPADDEREVVRPQLRVRVGRVRIRVARRRQDRADLHTRHEALLSQGQSFELVEPVLFGGALGAG
jgi:hypothetical protein